jgi:hypothetical protein
MATIPDEDEAPQPTSERLVHALTAPITERPRGAVLLTIAAMSGSLAPFPFGAFVAGACVLAAFELARRR